MNNSHLAGGGIAALIGFVAANYGWAVSQDEALMFGAAAAGLGAGVIHLFQAPGLIPRVKAALGLQAGPPPA